MEKEKMLVIVNPKSGTGRQAKVVRSFEKLVDKINFDYEIVESQYAHHGTELAKAAVGKGYDVVVAVGGDGSVNDVAAGLEGTSTKLGIIPCGSGNGLARCLKIPVYPSRAVAILNDNKMKRIDTLSVNGRFCVSLAGVGFDALIAKQFQEKPKNSRGFKSYLQLIANEYPTYKPKAYKFEIDGKIVEKSAMFVCFANSNQFGYEATVAPDARIDDGLIDVCFVKNIPILAAPPMAVLLFSKNLDLSPHVDFLRTSRVKVLNNDFEWVNIDGEPCKIGREFEISVNHKSLCVIC
ncbi:MAG: diacylglycerol kinase family lipid kinase [Bacteroidales bacterium]|nr:diacylglycerol kinase family lipid kinase [Bacteroidales bacterium]